MVVAEDASDSIQEGGLSIGPGAVQEEQGMLAGDAGQGVPGHALQEGDKVSIVIRDPL